MKKLKGIIRYFHIFHIIDLVLHKQSLISLGTTVIPRGNKVQGLWKNLGGQTRRVMGDVQMADVE